MGKWVVYNESTPIFLFPQVFGELSLQQVFSIREDFAITHRLPTWGHLAMSRDIFGCYNWEGCVASI